MKLGKELLPVNLTSLSPILGGEAHTFDCRLTNQGEVQNDPHEISIVNNVEDW